MQKKHILFYLFVFVLQLGAFFLIHAHIQLVILFVMLVLPIYSIWALQCVTKACTVEYKFPDETAKNQTPMKIQFTVNNPTRNPLFHTTVTIGMKNVQQKKKGAHRFTMPLRAHTKTRISYPVIPQGKGVLQIDFIEIELQDILGFVKKKKRCLTASE